MTEPIFQLLHQPTNNIATKSSIVPYNQLLLTYVNQNYGYYAQQFIQKIATNGVQQYQVLLKYNLKKSLREIVKKLMMSDLEIIFLSHFLELNKWNLDNRAICKSIQQAGELNDYQDFQNDHTKLKLFLLLVGFFVKSYVSDQTEVQVIEKKLSCQIKSFSQLYQSWLESNPKEYYYISPRKLNLIYSKFTRSTQRQENKKDYNGMVDRILELSTTYSMMPSTHTNNRKVKKQNQIQKSKKGRKKVKLNESQNVNQTNSSKISSKGNNSKSSNMFGFQKFDDSGFILPHHLTRKNSSQIEKNRSHIEMLQSMLIKKQKQKQDQKKKSFNNLQHNMTIPKGQPQNQVKIDKVQVSKKVTLKNKRSGNDVKQATNDFFQQKNTSGISVQDYKKDDTNNGNISFLDFNVRSSVIDILPFNIRNSNFSGALI